MKMYFIEVEAPWKPARHIEAQPVSTKYVSDGRRRYRVGVSAFECLRVATHHRRVRLQKLVKDGFLMRHNHNVWFAAKQALAAMPADT